MIMMLKWAEEKQSWRVEKSMEVIFSDDSRICICQGDDVETLNVQIKHTEMEVWRKQVNLFQSENVSRNNSKSIKAFLLETHIKSMPWPVTISIFNWKFMIAI